MSQNSLGHRLKNALLARAEAFARRLRGSFYLWLAAAFSLLVLADAALFHVGANMKQKAFDLIIQNRLVVPPADAEIVILDIDEKSLAALAPEYGRWPWPRQVMGELLEGVMAQQPRALVFDILFSDADIYHPDSDAYFDAAIAAAGERVFFPYLRLDPSADSLSQVPAARIAGVSRLRADADPRATLAVVLPHLPAALAGGRLGTHNIWPDKDGIVRRYRFWLDDYGWQLPSLPLTVNRALGGTEPARAEALLNWRGQPFSYRYVSFADVLRDRQARNPARPADEFRDKIVIVGSTAPALFDLKATAMHKQHPGVEILATAIDNLRHGDYLRIAGNQASYLLSALAIVWATAFGFYRNVSRERFRALFGGSQAALLTVSYLSLNLSNTYIDLTAPVTVAFAYFSVARLYAFATERALHDSLLRAAPQGAQRVQALLLLLRPQGEADLKKLATVAAGGAALPCHAAALKGLQKGAWAAFENLLAVSWVIDADDATALAAARADADAAAERVSAALAAQGGALAAQRLHEAPLPADAKAGWRVVFAEAVLRLEQDNPTIRPA